MSRQRSSQKRKKTSKKKKSTGIFYTDKRTGKRIEYTQEQLELFRKMAGPSVRKIKPYEEEKKKKRGSRPVLIDLTPKIPWKEMTLDERAKQLQRVWRVLGIDKGMRYEDYLRIVTPVSVEGLEKLFKELKYLSKKDQVNLLEAFAKRAEKSMGKELKKIVEEFKKRMKEGKK